MSQTILDGTVYPDDIMRDILGMGIGCVARQDIQPAVGDTVIIMGQPFLLTASATREEFIAAALLHASRAWRQAWMQPPAQATYWRFTTD